MELENHIDASIVREGCSNARNKDEATPLHYAAYFGQMNLAVLLLTWKAEVNAKAINGMTPLQMALIKGHKDVAELLRQHGGYE